MQQLERQLSAQQAVLGSLLIAPEICGDLFQRVQPEDFVTPELRTVYNAARDLFHEGQAVDPVSICFRAGGDQYRKLLIDLMDLTPTAANWEVYADIMVEQAKLYRWRAVLERSAIVTTLDDARQMTSKAEEQIMDHSNSKVVGAAEGMTAMLTEQGTEVKTISYGIRRLDSTLHSQRGEFVVIGARPSTGKTAFALQAASTMAANYRVGFFSLETSPAKIYNRLISNFTGVDFNRIRLHRLEQEDVKIIAASAGRFSKLQFECIQAAGMTVEDIQSLTLARRYDVIFVDYLQMIRSKGANRTEEVGRISMALATLARAHNLLVVALAQLHRPEKESEKLKAPTMASFRESGQIEQDADAVLLLYLTDPKNPKSDRRFKIAKNKEGILTAFDMAFDGAHQQFTERVDTDNPYAHKGRPIHATPVLSQPVKTPEAVAEQLRLERQGYIDVSDDREIVINPEEIDEKEKTD